MKRVTLSEQAYTALKGKISKLDSGTHLSVRSFCEEVQMGYTPVREAFLRLEREGLLRQIPNVGFLVQSYDIPAIIHYYQTRECLEPFVLKNVFDHLTPEDISTMEREFEACSAAIRADDSRGFIPHDIAFHMVMFDRYKNPHLSNLYQAIREQNMYFSRQNNSVLSYAINDHLQLLDAIRAGDCPGAVDILNAHIAHARTNMIAGFTLFSE